MNRSLRSFFIASLLLNLLLAGMLLGNMGQNLLATGPQSPQQTVATLPADMRERFNKAMTKTKLDLAPLRAEIDGTRRAALCLLNHDTFDKKAYLATTEKLHGLYGQMARRMNAAVADAAYELSPAARIAFVDMLKPPPPVRNLTADCGDTKEQ